MGQTKRTVKDERARKRNLLAEMAAASSMSNDVMENETATMDLTRTTVMSCAWTLLDLGWNAKHRRRILSARGHRTGGHLSQDETCSVVD